MHQITLPLAQNIKLLGCPYPLHLSNSTYSYLFLRCWFGVLSLHTWIYSCQVFLHFRCLAYILPSLEHYLFTEHKSFSFQASSMNILWKSTYLYLWPRCLNCFSCVQGSIPFFVVPHALHALITLWHPNLCICGAKTVGLTFSRWMT